MLGVCNAALMQPAHRLVTAAARCQPARSQPLLADKRTKPFQLDMHAASKRKQEAETHVASKRKQEAYSVALRELESSRLYGQTPKMFELDQLANMLKKGRLNLFPKYQRDYVWKPERASRLVVTVLCNRIVPGVVLHEKEKGVYDVVDGKQRLTSLLCFYMAGEERELLRRLMSRSLSASENPIFERLTKLDDSPHHPPPAARPMLLCM
jgi:hypothetical protein